MDSRPGIKIPLWYKAYCSWMFFWATMVSISRVFVGRHYLGDVLVGMIIGSLAGYIFGLAARMIIKKTDALL